MSEDAIREALTGIFRRVLRDEKLVLEDGLGGFDSIAYITLIAEIEREFRFAFSTREIHRMSTVGDFVCTIASRCSMASARDAGP